MIALFCLFLTPFASPFESKSRLAASRCCCTDADLWRVALKRCHGAPIFCRTRLKWALWFVGLTVLRKNKLKCPLYLINIPRQSNVRRLESIIYRRFVDFQVLDKDIITGDFQFVRDFTPGIFVADTGVVHLKPSQVISGVSSEFFGHHNHAGFSIDNLRTGSGVYFPGEEVVNRLLKDVIFRHCSSLQSNRPKKRCDCDSQGQPELVAAFVQKRYAGHRLIPVSTRSI